MVKCYIKGCRILQPRPVDNTSNKYKEHCHCLIPSFSIVLSEQVVVGSFLPGHQQEQKHKKQRTEPAAAVVSPTAVHTMSTEEIKVSYGGVRPILTSPFPGDNLGTLNPIQAFRNSAIDNKSSSAGEESKGHSLSQCEVSS